MVIMVCCNWLVMLYIVDMVFIILLFDVLVERFWLFIRIVILVIVDFVWRLLMV